MKYCCEEKKEWYKHAEEMSDKLSSLSGKVQPSRGHGENFTSYEFKQLPRDLKKLTELRDFARKIWANRYLHTKKWPLEKLASLDAAIDEKIEVHTKEVKLIF